jgi:nitrite reductase (NADH) small subunit
MIIRVLPQAENYRNTMEMPQQENSKGDAAIHVCRVDDLPLGLGRAFDIQGRVIALFRTRGGKVFAVDNRCPHKNGPLSEGMLAGESVVCPLHAFRFDMNSGECDQPGACSLKTYPVEQIDGQIYLSLSPGGDRKEHG